MYVYSSSDTAMQNQSGNISLALYVEFMDSLEMCREF